MSATVAVWVLVGLCVCILAALLALVGHAATIADNLGHTEAARRRLEAELDALTAEEAPRG